MKVTQEHKDFGACSNDVTICPERNVTTCPNTVSLIKHEIAQNVLQILFKGLCDSYSETTSINEKARKHELWIHIHLT